MTFKGNYTGTLTAKYTVAKAKLTVSGTKAANKLYNGNTNADFAQPIRYVVSGNNIEILETMALDTPNKFKSAKFTYTEDEGKKFEGEINGQTVAFSAGASDITYIFVPNDRKSHAANIYKMGTFSQVSPTNNPKIIPYGKYNIEPYFVPNANGGFDRKVFVIYNENIDAQPNYRSETIVVEKREQKENSGAYVWTITPKSGYGNSKSSYNTVSLSSINAFVLDANFERMRDEHGNYIKREVMPGDVIRFGHAPGGAIMNLEILYDISEDLENRKEITYDNIARMQRTTPPTQKNTKPS